MNFISTNKELQELAREAKENLLFDKDTDPDGKVAAGLDIILGSDIENSEVADIFRVKNFPKGFDKWDALENYAHCLDYHEETIDPDTGGLYKESLLKDNEDNEEEMPW